MNILFVDDHTIFREGVASFIEADKQYNILFTAADIDTARTILENEQVDLLITDINFPGESGLELLDYLQEEKPEVSAIVLSMLDELETIQNALRRGARGYVTKSSDFDTLARAIKEVSSGGYHFDQQVLAKLVKCVTSWSPMDGNPDSDQSVLGLLSERQREIFLLLAEGNKTDEISEELYISPKTVENHRSQIYKKLGVKDRMELHKFAEELNLL
ncbi:MAG: response regulator transcription factor [Spirochaetales bacterium]|nr:response regulator transcription factor [Spirochaetales bacterium]